MVCNSEKEEKDYCEIFLLFDFCEYSKIYSKTPKTIYKKFAKPLNMEILSLFSKFTKVSRDLLFLMQGNFFFFLHWKLHSVKCNASRHPHPPIRRWCTSSPPLAWKQCSRNRIELGVCDLRFVFLSGGSRYQGAFLQV